MNDLDFDKQIAHHRDEIERLIRIKQEQHERQQAIERAYCEILEVLERSNLTIKDVFPQINLEICEYVTATAKHDPNLRWISNLRELLTTKAGHMSPKLRTGSYRNPATGEVAVKKRKNPKQLDTWLNEHGFSTVSTWFVGQDHPHSL